MTEITTIKEYKNCINPLDIESINIFKQEKNFRNESIDLNNIIKYKNLKKICNVNAIHVTFSNIDIISRMFDDIDEINFIFIYNEEKIRITKYNNKKTIAYLIMGSELKSDSILNYLPLNFNTLIISNNTYCAYNNIFKKGLQNLPPTLKNIFFCQQLSSGSYYISDTNRLMKFILKSKLPYDCKIYLSDGYHTEIFPCYEVIKDEGILIAKKIIEYNSKEDY